MQGKARERMLEAEAWRMLATWQRSPAYPESQDRATLASDRAAIEAFAARLI